MEKSHYRAYIKTRCKLGIKAVDIHRELVTVYGDDTPSYSTVHLWYQRFSGGREDVEDNSRSGRPITAITPVNIERIRLFIEEDPWCTYDEIVAETSLSIGTISTILHDHLKMRKITSRWVPHFLSEKNKEERLRICTENLAKINSGKWRLCDIVTGDESWFYHRQIGRKQANCSWVVKGESPRYIVKMGRFEKKNMFCIFFKQSGVLSLTYLDKGETISGESYINDCLKPLVGVLNKQRPTCGTKNLKFHHDNARPHVQKGVVEYLKSEEFILMEHPPYSPDLAPCDFWLFDYIKKRLNDHTSAQSLASEITKIVREIPKEELKKTFEKWVERMELCLKNKGDYFEHLC